MRVTATIGRAGLPPMNVTAPSYGDWVTVLTDIGGGPVRVTSVVKLHPDRWLLPGSQVVIDLEPNRVGKVKSFTIDWSSVPPIRDRVAANDPILADPRPAWRSMDAALASAGRIRPMPGGSNYLPNSGSLLDVSWSAQCDAAIAATASTPAPPGMIRVVAIVSAIRLVYRYLGHDLAGRPKDDDVKTLTRQLRYRRAVAGNETVLGLHTAGRAPWSVFLPHFNAPFEKDVTRTPSIYPWLPALVAADGSGGVQVLWDEVLPHQQQTVAAWQQHTQAQVDAARAEMARHQPAGIDLPEEAHHEAMAFAKMYPTAPPHRQQAGIAMLWNNLNAASPELRDAYLAMWRSYGIPI
jgi:hypothetical protein